MSPNLGDMEQLTIPTAAALKDAAENAGLTITSLCRRADVDYQVFYRWSRGKGSINTGTLQKLLDALQREKDRQNA
jgi:transcriptional regulator with XRE-family HTH domain